MATSKQKHEKDPEARLDYDIDLTPWMEDGDFLTAVVWTIESITGDPAPLANDGESFTNFVAKIWLIDGTLGNTYTVTAHITTNDAREDDVSIFIEMVNK